MSSLAKRMLLIRRPFWWGASMNLLSIRLPLIEVKPETTFADDAENLYTDWYEVGEYLRHSIHRLQSQMNV